MEVDIRSISDKILQQNAEIFIGCLPLIKKVAKQFMKISSHSLSFFHKIVEERAKNIDLTELNLSESICHKCGVCCYTKKWLKNNQVEISAFGACSHLNKNNTCDIYEQRFLRTHCVNIESALLACILPESCGYIKTNWEKIKDWYQLPVLERKN